MNMDRQLAEALAQMNLSRNPAMNGLSQISSQSGGQSGVAGAAASNGIGGAVYSNGIGGAMSSNGIGGTVPAGAYGGGPSVPNNNNSLEAMGAVGGMGMDIDGGIFSQIFPMLQGYMNQESAMACRAVCKDWKQGVDVALSEVPDANNSPKVSK